MASLQPSILSSDESFFSLCLLFLYLIIPPAFVVHQFLQAPYGKHFRPGWGPSLPPTIAWPTMESPTLFIPLSVFPYGRNRSNPIAIALISFYLLHYFHRTCLYPLYLKAPAPVSSSSSSRAAFPLSMALLGFFLNLLNAYVQTRWISHYADFSEIGLWFWIRVLVGSAVFFCGFVLNVWSDRALVKLKREARGGYRVPRGGMFELVCSPNYLGEAVEWLAWALMTWSWVGLWFFLFTCANLVPRARAHRQWYLEKFPEEFPRSRKAILPFVY